MGVKKGQIIELEIEDLAFGGRGLAKADGFTVFVDQAVPKDLVRARVVRKKKNYAEARTVELVKPSPYRIEPECIYSGFCGGCAWQFLQYKKQLEYKRNHVADAIERIGLIPDAVVHPAIPSEKVFGYRNKMEFSCSDKRWLLPHEMEKDGIDTGFALGLHVPGTFYKVLDTRKCFLQPDPGSSILEDIRGYIKNSDAPVYGLRGHKGFWRFAMLRHSVAEDRWMVNIITAHEDRESVQPLADSLIEKYSQIVSVVNNINSRKAGIAIGEYEILLQGSTFLKERIGRYEFEISSNSFFQTNTRGAEKLYHKVKEYARLSGDETVVDLYSGIGTITIILSDSAGQVQGLEISRSAVADAQKNCRNNDITNCVFIAGDIRESLVNISEKPDVMVIDPPRAGMHKDVVKQVLDMKPERIVYVSCNPATLARDLGILKDKYRIFEVQPVDMFPHTYHIESVARIERK